MKRLRIKLILVSYLLLSFGSPLFASNGSRHINMFTMEQVPYGFMNDNGEYEGVLYDVMNQIIEHSNIGDSNFVVPSKRIFLTMSTKKKSCALLANTPDISNAFVLIEPIGYPLLTGILPRAGIKLVNYASLQNKIIAIPLGVYFDERLDKDETLSTLRPAKYTQAIKMLKLKRVDAIAGPISSLLFIGKKEGVSVNEFDAPLVFKSFEVMLVCTNDLTQDTLVRLKQSVIYLRNSGIIQKILDSYYQS